MHTPLLAAALFALAACAQSDANGGPTPGLGSTGEAREALPVPASEEDDTTNLLTGRPWQVTAVGDTPVAASLGMTVRFTPEGSISGYSGCNRYEGRYELVGEGISTRAVVATQRACLDPATTQLESDALAALGTLRQFRIADDELVLVSESGTQIAARR